ncbi:MAG: SDR family oxidoreductase [Candidatus Methanomethyliaceae archaeon]|nr:SDR family oxidoreductase [Candidatus Methanomethyliaceae archaeon]MDW7970436.1 SDR family NAD(P)-dependent oxidoreductase [Nitrososphaerota archaeon]
MKDKIAIVTGAARGIGREIAMELAKNGVKIALIDIDDGIFKVRKEIEAFGGEALAIKCDVSNNGDVEKAVNEIIAKFGKIDILINNAGIYPFKQFIDMTEEDWDRVLNVNLKSVFYFTKMVLPKMIEQRKGKIINIASIAGSVIGFPNLTHYSASKAAIVGFTKALALEVAKYGINVNSISPGPILTPGTMALGEEMYEQIKRSIPLGRWGEPKDVANLVLFLASDKSDFITGQNIVIDGGYTLH